MHRTISRSLAVIMLSVTPAVAVAQSATKPPAAQGPIPLELALALLDLGPSMGAADIWVGKAPDFVPSDLLPTGLERLGSTIQYESSVIVLATRDQPDSAAHGGRGEGSRPEGVPRRRWRSGKTRAA